MDFHKPENTTTPSTTTTTTTKRMMMMMMKNKSSSSSSTPQKNPNNFDDHDHHHHHHLQCSDNTTTDQHDETPVTEEKKQKRYTTTSTTTSSKRCSANSGGGGSSGGGGGGVVSCQAEKCTADLGEAKRYHRRHKVCEFHAKAPSVLVSGLRQRFCQQCSRFHELSEFDETKRSCRRRLAGHNERRRKNSLDQGEGGSSSQTKGSSPQISYAGTNNNGTTSFKQFQIR